MKIINYILKWMGISRIIFTIVTQISSLINKIKILTQDLILLNENINDIREKSTHQLQFPTVSQIEWRYIDYTFPNLISKTELIRKFTIKLNNYTGLTTDFRYKNQSNHRLYIKFYSNKHGDLTSWLNGCEAISPLGIIDKDDTSCLLIKDSLTEKRVCCLNKILEPDTKVFIRFGIKTENINDIVPGTIEILFH